MDDVDMGVEAPGQDQRVIEQRFVFAVSSYRYQNVAHGHRPFLP
jgi:hypothetical protein